MIGEDGTSTAMNTRNAGLLAEVLGEETTLSSDRLVEY